MKHTRTLTLAGCVDNRPFISFFFFFHVNLSEKSDSLQGTLEPELGEIKMRGRGGGREGFKPTMQPSFYLKDAMCMF